MPALKNGKWEAFAAAVATHGKHGQAAIEAGYPPDYSSVRGAQLMGREHIRERVLELRTKYTDQRDRKVKLSRQWVIDSLMRNAESALEARDRNAANRALELLGREVGLFVERKAIEVTSPLDSLDARALMALIVNLDKLEHSPSPVKLIEGTLTVDNIEADAASAISDENTQANQYVSEVEEDAAPLSAPLQDAAPLQDDTTLGDDQA